MGELRITEKRNIATMELDLMNVEEILTVINKEDCKVIAAVEKEIPVITRVIQKIIPQMKKGGRLFYVGAGTSGRLGVLDAVECTPTFGVEPDKVIGVMAGGQEAMFLARENIEDNYELGAEEARKYEVAPEDCIIGIAASGDTPFVLGFIKEARSKGALTFGLCCNHGTSLEKEVELTIKPIVGPEVVTGSTRMKAGTAQKLVLNMISTTVMIKLNKVYSNLMVDLKVNNKKLRERAEKIFTTITDAEDQLAENYLQQADYNIKRAIVMYVRECSAAVADKLLEINDGNLREIIG
jgi:N-acetylmuramic acid 6-phosphate etherase